MPAKSIIDFSDQRAAIERDLAINQVPLVRLAKKYGLSVAQLKHHKKKMPPQMKATLLAEHLGRAEDFEKLHEQESTRLLTNLAVQRVRLLIEQDKAIAEGDRKAIAAFSSQIHKNLEMTGRYTGQFGDLTTQFSVNLLIAPEYLELRSGLVRALAQHPQARKAVMAVFRELENRAVEAQPKLINGHAEEVRNGD